MTESMDTQPPQPADAPAQTLPQKSINWWKWTTLFLLFLIAGGGVFIMISQKTSPTITPPIPATLSPAKPVSADPTANWKVYTNIACGYQLKYPENWQILPQLEDTNYGATVLYPYEVGSGIEPPDDWFKLQIGCAPKSPNSTPRSIVDSLNQRDTGYGVPKVQNSEQITLNGSPAIRQTLIPSVGPSVLEYYIFPDGDKYYTLGFTPANTNAKDIINQILSTFRFIP